MNLKVLFMFLLYYTFISMLFTFGGSYLTGYSTNINTTNTTITESEVNTSILDTGLNFVRFIGFVSFGVGLADDTPGWFATIFIFWQTLMTILFIGFLISSIWNG